MRQDRKPKAGKQKHNHGEHRVRIFDRHTCLLVCLVLRCGPRRYLTLQLSHFRSSLDRIVHLPVPSENMTRRGKKISKSFPPTADHAGRTHGTRRRMLERRNKETNGAKKPRKPAQEWPPGNEWPQIGEGIRTRALAAPAATGHGRSYDSKDEPRFSPRLPDTAHSTIETREFAINVLSPVPHELKMTL